MKIITLTFALSIIASPCVAQTRDSVKVDEQIVLQRLETNQRAIYAVNLGLTDEESKTFWSIYDEYEADIKKVTEERLELMNALTGVYVTLSDAEAEDMLATLWESEREALRIRQKYARKVQRVLPGAKALRYVQLQAYIDTLLLRRAMSLVPLAH